MTRNLHNQQCVHCCVYKVPLGFCIDTAGQEINLQCEMDAVCVWLSAVLELLKVDLNPQVKIKLCTINCLKLQVCTVTCTSTMYIQNPEETTQILYIHISTCTHIMCVYIFTWKQSMTRTGTHEINWTIKSCRMQDTLIETGITVI